MNRSISVLMIVRVDMAAVLVFDFHVAAQSLGKLRQQLVGRDVIDPGQIISFDPDGPV